MLERIHLSIVQQVETKGSLTAAAGVLKNRDCSAYPAVLPEVTLAGGTAIHVPIDGAHTCGKLVTGPAWPAHPTWLAQFLKVLGTTITV